MTVLELKQLLDNYSDNTEVMIAAPSNDYWGTIKALPIHKSDTDLADVTWSSYHNSDKVVDPDHESDDDEKREVLLLQ